MKEDGQTVGIIRNTDLDSGFTTFIFSSRNSNRSWTEGGEKVEKGGEVKSQVGFTPKFVERDEIRSSVIPQSAIVSILSFFFSWLISRDELITGEESNGGESVVGLSIYRISIDTIRCEGERQERRFRGWLNFRWRIEGGSYLRIWRKYRVIVAL